MRQCDSPDCVAMFAALRSIDRFCSKGCQITFWNRDGKARLCRRCGGPMVGRNGGQRYCGDQCRDANRADDLKAHNAKTNAARTIIGPGQVKCQRCGDTFTSKRPKVAKWCSDTCAGNGRYKGHQWRQDAAAHHGITKRQLEAALLDIARTAGFRCHYCPTVCSPGVRPLRKGGVNWHALTFDHIVPQAKGGTHDWSNLVPACWRCNHSKSDQLVA